MCTLLFNLGRVCSLRLMSEGSMLVLIPSLLLNKVGLHLVHEVFSTKGGFFKVDKILLVGKQTYFGRSPVIRRLYLIYN